MANDKNFKIKNGLSAGRYLGTNGTPVESTANYGLASSSYDGASSSLDVSGQDTAPYDIYWKSDGTELFVLGRTNDTVYQYSMSTGWDLANATNTDSKSVALEENQPNGLFFKPDGTIMYITGTGGDDINTYSLDPAWDVSTATYVRAYSLSSQTNNPNKIQFKSDGTKMFMFSDQYNKAFQYSLSTAWTVSTASVSYDNVEYDFSAKASGSGRGLYFKDDGTKMYFTADGIVNQYSLSTPWDISSSSVSDDYISFDATNEESGNGAQNIAFKDDGSKMYLVGTTGDMVHQYSSVETTKTLDLSTGTDFSLTPTGAITIAFSNPPASGTAVGFTLEVNNTSYTLTWPTSIKWHGGSAPAVTSTKEVYAFFTKDGGTTYYGKRAGENIS